MNPVAFLFPIILPFFLAVLKDDEYQVLIEQKQLFAVYDKMLPCIAEVESASMERSCALLCAQALFKGANVYRRMATDESLQKAVCCHEKALIIRKKHLHKHALDLAHSYAALGATYNELKGASNNLKAIVCYSKGLKIYHYHREKGREYVASTLSKLANACRDLDDCYIPRAIRYLNYALDIFVRLSDTVDNQREQAKIFYNQGINYHRLGGEENRFIALGFLLRARNFFEKHDDIMRYAITLSYLGHVYTTMGREYKARAIACLEQALLLQRSLYTDDNSLVRETLERLNMAKEV